MDKNTLRSTDELMIWSSFFCTISPFDSQRVFSDLEIDEFERPDTLEGDFLHEEVDVMVDLESVQIVCVSLEPHEEAAKGDIC